MTHGADIDGGSTAGLDGLRYMRRDACDPKVGHEISGVVSAGIPRVQR